MPLEQDQRELAPIEDGPCVPHAHARTKSAPMLLEGARLSSMEDAKKRYFSRLLSGGLCQAPSTRSSKSQTVVIFDWDDTLLCTTFLNRHYPQGATLPPKVQAYLRTLEQVSVRLIEIAMEVGQAYIVTNATPGWVEESAARWAPNLLPVLERVKVISARDRWSSYFPQDVYQWKIRTFRELHRYLPCVDRVMNIVAIGDADFEMQAAASMGQQFELAVVKTVKLKQLPSPPELVKELELVKEKFDQIHRHGRNLKISLERRR
jgi:FMN phosphatase YigB (HAD superfamily)